MRLLTLNSLKCPAKDVVNGYPLLIEITDFEVSTSDFNQEFIVHMLPSLNWQSICLAAKAVGLDSSTVPESFSVFLLEDLDFLKAMHYLLIDIHVESGFLICPDTKRKFPIENGIPNMM